MEYKIAYVITPLAVFTTKYHNTDGYIRTWNDPSNPNVEPNDWIRKWYRKEIDTTTRDKKDWSQGMSLSGMADWHCHHMFCTFNDEGKSDRLHHCDYCKKAISSPEETHQHIECCFQAAKQGIDEGNGFCNCLHKTETERVMVERLLQTDLEIYDHGELVFIIPCAEKDVIQKWVDKVARESGERVDWHYRGGRARILALVNEEGRKRVVSKIQELREELGPSNPCDQFLKSAYGFELITKAMERSKVNTV